jgi:valyl-tRNA synthetase
VPWTNAAISGWILDPDRKKMSKSKGNVVTPEDVVKEHSPMRCATGRPPGGSGRTRRTTSGQIKVGRRLAIKVLNASKFALSFGRSTGTSGPGHRAARPSMLAGLADVVPFCTAGFEAWDFTRALEVTESFFWTFCDDYLELVKDRAYGGQGEAAAASARARCGSRSTCAAPARPDPALRHRRGVVLVARGVGAPLTGILEFADGDEVAARDIELVAVAKPTA